MALGSKAMRVPLVDSSTKKDCPCHSSTGLSAARVAATVAKKAPRTSVAASNCRMVFLPVLPQKEFHQLVPLLEGKTRRRCRYFIIADVVSRLDAGAGDHEGYGA